MRPLALSVETRGIGRTVYYAYVTDAEERLLGIVTFRDLLITTGDETVQDVTRTRCGHSAGAPESRSAGPALYPLQSADDPGGGLAKAYQRSGHQKIAATPS
jgi:hypothetical protein